jgi:hypothetical protein
MLLQTKARNFWNSLPHQIQATAIIFVTVTGTTLGKELQALIFGSGAFTWVSLKHDLVAAGVAGLCAAWAFYKIPAGTTPQDLPPAVTLQPVTAQPPGK